MKLGLVLALAVPFACATGVIAEGQPIFVDYSVEAGFQPAFSANVPAGGIAVADFNGNGYPDIFVTGYNQPNRLFFNNGDGTFSEDPAINLQLAGERCSIAAAADFDNDGWPDLYVGCRYAPNHLFRNLAGQGFEDVTPPELQHQPQGPGAAHTDAVAWGDFSGNGFPDLFIGVHPASSQPDPSNPDNLDRIIMNHGDGQWTDTATLLDPMARSRTALAAAFSDITGNGRPDLLVVNDKLQGNSLWRNDGPGCGSWCWTDVADQVGLQRPVWGMGIAIGDAANDGLLDIYVSSIGEQVLFRQISSDPPLFIEAQAESGLDHNAVGWATLLADFTNDGWEDAYLAVGSSPEPSALSDRCFLANGDGSLEEATAACGLDVALPTQTAALIDFERNGRLDLVLGHWNAGYRLYRNQADNNHHWIGFELRPAAGANRFGIGSLVLVETPDGVIRRRELRAGESRGASHDPVLHFGLGEHDQAQVRIRWPDGWWQDLGSLAVDRYHSLDDQLVFGDDFAADF